MAGRTTVNIFFISETALRFIVSVFKSRGELTDSAPNAISDKADSEHVAYPRNGNDIVKEAGQEQDAHANIDYNHNDTEDNLHCTRCAIAGVVREFVFSCHVVKILIVELMC